jgi:hypothetical protein
VSLAGEEEDGQTEEELSPVPDSGEVEGETSSAPQICQVEEEGISSMPITALKSDSTASNLDRRNRKKIGRKKSPRQEVIPASVSCTFSLCSLFLGVVSWDSFVNVL